MLPVRPPIQVTLEDSDGSQVHCTRRAAQVKILRRPPNSKPVKSQQQPPPSSSAIVDPFEERLQLDMSDWPKPGQEWPHLKPPAASQPPTPSKPAPKLYSAIHNKSHLAAPTNTHLPSNKLPPPPPPSSSPSLQTQKAQPLKTYQERADEYARARLRILGSAFPQQDEHHDPDVNRLLDSSLNSLLSPDSQAPMIAPNGYNSDNNNSARINKIAHNNFYPDSNRARQMR